LANGIGYNLLMKYFKRKKLAQIAQSILIVALVTFFYSNIFHASQTTVALTLLLAVLFVATRWGHGVGIITATIAALFYNYFFLPPIHSLIVSDQQNWFALVAFFVVSLTASRLSQNSRDRAKEATRRRREVERLYDFSQHLLVTENVPELLNTLPELVRTEFQCESVAMFIKDRRRIYRSENALTALGDAELQIAATQTDIQWKDNDNTCYIPLRVGAETLGAIGISGGVPSRETLEALSSLVAVAVERAGTVEQLGKAEASRESERLRSALLDSVTHELRTPLTGITASITSLRSGMTLTQEQSDELLTVIEQESHRLNNLISQAVEMAQLDAGQVPLDIQPEHVEDLMKSVMQDVSFDVKKHPVELRVPEGLPTVPIDSRLIVKVMHHLMENAVKYSGPGKPIILSAEKEGGYLLLSIADRGAGIDPMEQALIFDKFYRGQGQRYRVSGTGMGLAIAKAIVEAHDGQIAVTSQLGQGSVFTVSLPLYSRVREMSEID
jgi:two-component system sensor histidine kinase KdpD